MPARQHPAVNGLIQALANLVRVSDQGAPYNEYFHQLNQELRNNGTGQPVLVIDLDRVDRNIETVKRNMTQPDALRLVVKSLPCPQLLKYIMEQTQCTKFMVFHRPFINQIAEEFPAANLLLGKPMPIQAVKTFYNELCADTDFAPHKQLQWLVDSNERLNAYLSFAKANNKQLLINIEIDVGLHRGGIQQSKDLEPLLQLIQQHPAHLKFTGFMGYDPHIPKAPSLIKPQIQAFTEMEEKYNEFKYFVMKHFPDLFTQELTFNGAGSPTYTLYKNKTLLNDLSVGSSFLKPTDFDTPNLMEHSPALYIAAPVLKKMEGTEIPFLEKFKSIFSWFNVNWSQSFFIYGGYWKAAPVAPIGLKNNRLYGHSSNQEIYNSSSTTRLNVEDHIFLRPTQSEAVLLQFGDIVVVREGQIVDRWKPLQQ